MPRACMYSVNEEYFWAIDSAPKAYWLGVIAADGYIHQLKPGKLRLCLEVAIKDKSWLESFRSDIGSTHPIMQLRLDSKPSARIDITRFKFVQPLTSAKSGLILQTIHPSLRCHFIRGLFDGDGTVGCYLCHTAKGTPKTDYRWSLISENLDRINAVQTELVNAECIRRTKLLEDKGVWNLKAQGNQQVAKIADYLYPNGSYPYLSRKRKLMEECIASLKKARPASARKRSPRCTA